MTEHSPWSIIQSIAESRIAEAQARGEFDNLPGYGQPLRLDDNPLVPEELRMAYKILKNSNCLPPELEERKEVSRLIDLLENCADEQERVRQIEKVNFLLARMKMRNKKNIRLEEDDPYYCRIVQRLSKIQ